jgi:hypothetical protein
VGNTVDADGAEGERFKAHSKNIRGPRVCSRSL